MAESKAFSNTAGTHNNFKEAVCIDAGRIYDSCSDKDCLEDLMVVFAPEAQYVVDAATSIKVKGVEVLTVCLDVEPVPFNKGFYSVDMTFYFKVDLKAYTPNACDPATISGVAQFQKKVILYGSEGNVKIFTSRNCCEHPFQHTTNMPKASVQVADPIALDVQLVDCPPRCDCPCFPPEVLCHIGCENVSPNVTKVVLITIGLFTIVQIERDVQMMIPAYDFCVPEKECSPGGGAENPCDLFRRIKFPTNEFFPPNLTDLNDCED